YPLLVVFFFFSSYAHHRDLHSFPTRRSSDLPLPLAAHELHILRAPLHDSGGGRPRSDDGVAAAARRGRILLARRLAHRLRSEPRSEEHTSELQSLAYLVCRLLLEKKKKTTIK